MKKNVTVILAMLLIGATAFGQAVMDRNVIPVSVNLNQVLRMNVTNGGNIEFVFNNIDEYKAGLSADAATSASANDAASEDIYRTNFTISSSTNWQLFYGAERDALYGVDDPTQSLALDNIGIQVNDLGVNTFVGTQVASAITTGGTVVAPLTQYDGAITILETGATGNAGDAADNAFEIEWRCGTSESTMNANALIDQSLAPDRYTVNVLFDLAIE